MDIHRRAGHTNFRQEITISTDGVNETKSTSRSLHVLSLKFVDCVSVYTAIIMRPEVHMKSKMMTIFDVYLSRFFQQCAGLDLKILKSVADAPERARNRKQKQFGGYHSCDMCTAKAKSIDIPGKQASNETQENNKNNICITFT